MQMHTQKYIQEESERCVKPGHQGKEGEFDAVQPQTGITMPEGNGDTMEEVPGTFPKAQDPGENRLELGVHWELSCTGNFLEVLVQHHFVYWAYELCNYTDHITVNYFLLKINLRMKINLRNLLNICALWCIVSSVDYADILQIHKFSRGKNFMFYRLNVMLKSFAEENFY